MRGVELGRVAVLDRYVGKLRAQFLQPLALRRRQRRLGGGGGGALDLALVVGAAVGPPIFTNESSPSPAPAPTPVCEPVGEAVGALVGAAAKPRRLLIMWSETAYISPLVSPRAHVASSKIAKSEYSGLYPPELMPSE